MEKQERIPLTKENAHRVKSIRRIGTDEEAVLFHFRKGSARVYPHVHTYGDGGSEAELRPKDFNQWEVATFHHPGYLEGLEKMAYDAYRWSSFDPEVRAETDVMNYERQLHEDLQQIPEEKQEDYIRSYRNKLSEVWNSQSRCANPMVTGRSGFNVSRHEKAENAYQNKYNAFMEWRERFLNAMRKIKEAACPEEEKLEKAWYDLKRDIESSAKTINEIDTGKVRGYHRALFVSSIQGKVTTLANRGEVEIVQRAVDYISEFNARVKKPIITARSRFFQLPDVAREARVKLAAVKEQENSEITFEGGTLVYNYEADRLQILFDGIPDDNRRKTLKTSGFRWSPKHKAWQRQLTRNAISTAKRLLNIKD